MTLVNNDDLVKLTNTQLFIQDVGSDYIYISQFPNYFGIGKNSFLVGIKEKCFQPDTDLNIFFLDSKGVSRPVVVTQYIERLYIRCYVEVDQTFPIGFGILVVVGTLNSYNEKSKVPSKWSKKPNIKHQRRIYVNPNEITPSVLRFKTKPPITLYPDDRKLYSYNTNTSRQQFYVTAIGPAPNGSMGELNKGYATHFMLTLQPLNNSQSVWHEKFLNYTIFTESIHDVTQSYKSIFSGSVGGQTDWPNGNYVGKIQAKENVTLSVFNGTIYNGKAEFGSLETKYPDINKIHGTSISQFKASAVSQYQYLMTLPDTTYTAQLQLNSGSKISSLQVLYDTDYILPTQFITNITSSTNTNLSTTYFVGTMSSETSKVVATGFTIQKLNKTDTIYGYKYNPLIKDKNKIAIIQLEQDKEYSELYQFSGSCSITCNGSIQFIGADLNDYSFLNIASEEPISFDSLNGEIFSKQITIERTTGKYFTGSLKGVGSFFVLTGGSLRVGDKYRQCLEGQVVTITKKTEYIGDGTGANLDIQRFSGSIISGSVLSKNIQHTETYSAIDYRKLYIQSKLFNADISNIDTIEVKVPSGVEIIYPELNFTINSYSYPQSNLIVESNQKVFIQQLPSEEGSQIIQFQGRFNLGAAKQFGSDCTFEGVFQAGSGSAVDYQIQKYELLSCVLSQKYQNIFNTSEMYFYNGDYNHGFIPIAIDTKNIDYDLLLKELQEITETVTWSQSVQSEGQGQWITTYHTNSYLEFEYSYKNEYDTGKYLQPTNTYPLQVVIGDVSTSIYSGQLYGYSIYYNDTSIYGTTNYQHLTDVTIPLHSVFPITTSISIPTHAFSGDHNLLRFVPIDYLGNSAPEDFVTTIRDVDLTSVFSSSTATIFGFIDSSQTILDAANVSFNNQTYITVEQALNHLLGVNGTGAGGGTFTPYVDMQLDYESQNVLIRDSSGGGVTISWQYQPDSDPSSLKYDIYTSPYPSETDWSLSQSDVSVDSVASPLELDDVSSSCKIVLKYAMGESTYFYSRTHYIYMRNYLYCITAGKLYFSSPQTTIDWINSNTTMSQTFVSQHIVNAGQGEYIYFACPTRMTASFGRQPRISVGPYAGGFIKLETEPSLQNEQNYSQTYVVYKSVHSGLGACVVDVS